MDATNSGKRVSKRHQAELAAECRLGGSSLVGHIRDVSTGGVFFAFEPRRRQAHTLVYEPELGDLVLLAYAGDGETERTVATVRWRGQSDAHGSDGMGLELTET